jgi:predicted 2-oxoglutarate/Fe(II)-dependent dioxygenase YbiX
VDERARRTVRVAMPADATAFLTERLEASRRVLEERFGEDRLAWKDVQVLTYRPGDYFRAHRDRSAEPGHEASLSRRVAVVVFLNGADGASHPDADTFEGGTLTFYGLLEDPRLRDFGYPLRAEAGLLVAFRPTIVHEVTPVTRGERHVVVAWLVNEDHDPPGALR